jgi:hypothetical protein
MKTDRPLRRLAAAAICGGILALLAPGMGGAAENDFIAGSGNSYAQLFRVGPTASRLSLAPVVGLSLSDYLDTAGRGSASVADWAAIGVAEPSLPDNTPTLRVVSTQKGADKGTTEIVAGGTDGSGNGGGAFELFAKATKAPLGQSHFKAGHFAVQGLMDVSGGEAATSSGIIDRNGTKVRQSVATVTIKSFNFAGQILLTNMKWEAIQETTDAGRKVTGSFSLGGASLGGVPIPLPVKNGDLHSVLDPLNAAIADTGFGIVPPVFENSEGLAEVSPLSIQVINSKLGRQFLAPILGDLQPVREPITAGLIDLFHQLNEGSDDQIPDLTVGVLAADLTIGVLSGSSQAHLEIGGVEAYTEAEKFANPFDFKAPNLGAPSAPKTVFTPGTAGRPAIPGTSDDFARSDTTQFASSVPDQAAQKTLPGKKGGVAVAVGLAGLAVGLGLAVADWYRMRVSRRAATA